MDPKVEVPSALVVSQFVVTKRAMSIEDQTMLGKFLRLAHPRFSRALSENVYEFVISY